jgi:hypothetical protein
MRRSLTLMMLLTVGTVRAADVPKPNTLTADEIAEGWILLFDGETPFGWTTEGKVSIENGEMQVGGGEKGASASTTNILGDFQMRLEYVRNQNVPLRTTFNDLPFNYTDVRAAGDWFPVEFEVRSNARATNVTFITMTTTGPHRVLKKLRPQLVMNIGFIARDGEKTRVRSVKIKPLGLEAIFNGNDLSGWKQFTGNERQSKSKFTVTSEGWINIKNGPGDLQTEKRWADFVFQGECISNGNALNSGVFFRCIPGQYQQGYEYQIQNGYKDNDRTKPADFGTGAIYRRIPARKVVSNDHEWFMMTLIAHGRHISTWVNGYQTVDWTDERKENDNARNGCKLGAGPISLQGHDPTTDLSFRNLRIAELKKD